MVKVNFCYMPSVGFRRSFRLSKRDKKTNKAMYESKKSEMYDMADVPTYEEVTPHRRLAGTKHRLVVFVGRQKDSEKCHWMLSLSSSINISLNLFCSSWSRTLVKGPSMRKRLGPTIQLTTHAAFLFRLSCFTELEVRGSRMIWFLSPSPPHLLVIQAIAG